MIIGSAEKIRRANQKIVCLKRELKFKDTEINSLKETIQKQEKSKEHLKKQLKGEINKLNKVIDLMSRAILNYDDQLVINHYRDKEHVKETFTEYAMKEDK